MEFVAVLTSASAKCQLTGRNPPLGDKDATCIAEALRESSIAVLDLASNNITMCGAEDLAAAIRTNSTIAHLSVADNLIGCHINFIFRASPIDQNYN